MPLNAVATPTRDPTKDPSSTFLEDAMVVAFLKLKGYTCIPFISRDDPDDPRVSFDITGEGEYEDVEAALVAFYDNAQVGIQDLNRNFKEIKSTMYNMKRIGKK